MTIRSFGSTTLAITFAASILASATAACTVKTTGTGPAPTADGGKSSDDDDDDGLSGPKTGTKTDAGTKPGKPSSSTGSTCQQIFQCALECEDVDCEDACYAAGSTAGKAQVDALIACSQANACEDGECIITNCSEEYEACE